MFQIFRALANNLELLNFALNFYIYCLCRLEQLFHQVLIFNFSTILWLSNTDTWSCIAALKSAEPLFPCSSSAPVCSRASRPWVSQPEQSGESRAWGWRGQTIIARDAWQWTVHDRVVIKNQCCHFISQPLSLCAFWKSSNGEELEVDILELLEKKPLTLPFTMRQYLWYRDW